MEISQKLIDEIVAHARGDLPNECCGMIGGRDGEATKVVRVANAAASPLRYEMDPQGQFDALKSIEGAGDELIGIYHSHTRSAAYPSQTDVNQAVAWPEQVYVIVSLENEEEPDVKAFLLEDMKIRAELMKQLKQAAVSKIVIERPHKKCRVTIQSARPGVVIGKKGADIEKLRKKVAELTDSDVVINIVEIRKPELDAQLVAESIAQQLERRVAFRRAMKRAVQSAMRLGAGGIRINCSGRLGGAEIARMEWYREGRVPLHTLRADVDFGTATAKTTYGTCGVKVWVFRGEVLAHDPMAQDKRAAEAQPSR